MTTARRSGLTEQAADAAIDSACRMLRLPTIRSHFTDVAGDAARDQMSYRAFLAELLISECDDRARRRFRTKDQSHRLPPREVPADV